jgi:hypothetical protein
MIRRFGWRPDPPDYRDFKYADLIKPVIPKLPPEASVQSLFPPAYQQDALGSCVGQATKGLMAAAYAKQGLVDPVLSSLMIYYLAREIEGTIYEDVGCSPRDALKGATKYGVCLESLWPYLVEKFAIRPTDECYIDALNHQIIAYYSIAPSLTLLKNCIAEGYPFSAGVRVYENFPMELGDIPMPQGQEIGGHDIDVVAYSDFNREFIIRNSWGEGWGYKGYGSIPYDYLTDTSLSSDFWTIRTMETAPLLPNESQGCWAEFLKLFNLK